MNSHPAYQRNLSGAEVRAVTTRAQLDPESVGHEVVGLREELFSAQARVALLENTIKQLESRLRRHESTIESLQAKIDQLEDYRSG